MKSRHEKKGKPNKTETDNTAVKAQPAGGRKPTERQTESRKK